jgi:UDP-N-acetylglucosamine acyltransferase
MAQVEEGAKIGKGVVIEPYAIVKANVTLEDNVVIKSFAYIDGYTTVGEGTTIYPSACIGTRTQDLKFRGEKTFVKIGKRCQIREYVTINSSCQENTTVEVGDDCLIMAYCHVAHNCRLGNRVIMSNNATLAGHVEVEDCAIIGGFTPIHQFVRIGAYAMVGGMTRVGQDIPPYTIGGDIPFRLAGINRIGLRRHGFDLDLRKELIKAFRLLYRCDLPVNDALDRIESECHPFEEVAHFVEFCRNSKRGLIGFAKQPENVDEQLALEEEEEERALSAKS